MCDNRKSSSRYSCDKTAPRCKIVWFGESVPLDHELLSDVEVHTFHTCFLNWSHMLHLWEGDIGVHLKKKINMNHWRLPDSWCFVIRCNRCTSNHGQVVAGRGKKGSDEFEHLGTCGSKGDATTTVSEKIKDMKNRRCWKWDAIEPQDLHVLQNVRGRTCASAIR